MKNEILKRPRTTLTSAFRSLAPKATALLGALLFTVASAPAAEVDTVTGGPSEFNSLPHGYVDGDTAALAQFHNPWGIALDNTGTQLFVADRDNNAIRHLYLNANVTATFVNSNSAPINKPIGVVVDGAGNVYVLNRGNGNNGTVLKFASPDIGGDLLATVASNLVNAAGIALDSGTNIYVTVQSNTVRRITPAGTATNVATITHAGASLQGIAVKRDGRIAAADAGRHGIYLIDPVSGVVTTNSGFHGAGDFTTANNVASSATAKYNQPYGVSEAGDGTLVITDRGNHRVKAALTSGVVTNIYGVNSNYWYTGPGALPGWWDGTVAVPDTFGTVEARSPVGVLVAPDGTVYTTETHYHLIRKVTGTGLPLPPMPPPAPPTIFSVATNYGEVTLTWSAVASATGYTVKRSPSSGGPYSTLANITTTSYNDTSVINGNTYYYVVSASNEGGESPNSAEVSATVPMPPVDDPQIGYVDFPPPTFRSVFHAVSSAVFNNDKPIVIIGEAGTQTFYEYANTSVTADVPNPTALSASAPVGYEDGLFNVIGLTVASVSPDLTIKAVGHHPGRPNSATATAQFQFIVGNPLVIGNNAADFTVGDITTGAGLWFTTDGSDPTNAAPSQFAGTVAGTNLITLSLSFPPGITNMTFKIRGFKANYHASSVVSTTFWETNFNKNKISFGFQSGEASSDFVASPGQLFYSPVTMSILPSAQIYSLQFNMTVTNLGAAPPVQGGLTFDSMLKKPLPESEGLYTSILPQMFVYQWTNIIFYPDGSVATNLVPVFTNLVFANNNLLGVGWLERAGKTNLYNTLEHDLITYSGAHDILFEKSGGKIVVGGYGFRVPPNAATDHQYQIQIGRPSATSDGFGGPNSDVLIDTPTNLAAGTLSAVRNITVGQRKYVVGDVAPFRWFNAGDFGNTNSPDVRNDDVMQVFQSVMNYTDETGTNDFGYGLNMPPFDRSSFNGVGFTSVSDFFDGMDSCGAIGVDNGNGYLEQGPLSDNSNLFNGDDLTINQIAFGDGWLDVCDVYVTFRRSLDPSLQWFRRFWTNGVRGAETFPNVSPANPLPPPLSPNAIAPEIKFSAGDAIVGAGQTLSLPVTAQIRGDFPLRLLALGITVQPLDGSPAIIVPVQFIPNGALGAPSITSPRGAANYSAVWLNKAVGGLTGNAQLGTLQVTLPAGAGPNAAYAVHFDHASGSPNGLASFPSSAGTGLITLSDRSASSLNDGISDSWRLRHFATLNNLLASATADADGDGADNWQEFKAGTIPNDAGSLLKLKSAKGAALSATVQWPSVLNKQYVIERAASLFAPVWTPVSTNNGTGWTMEYQDPAPGGVQFYRVRVQP